jgi:S-adenosylmethionine hydrolase
VNTVTILTDFGLKDPYVGVMKGVMLAINPRLTFVDITHEVEPQDIREACFLVADYYRYFRPGTIHLCVIDPTVGSNRKALIITKDKHFFVGPDNGIFSFLLDGAQAFEITNRRFQLDSVSGTFHGRDVFAPAAAHLSLHTGPAEFGPKVVNPVELKEGLFPKIQGDCLFGEIVRFDRFGNAITNISFDTFSRFLQGSLHLIEVSDLSFNRVERSYYESEFTCVAGSSGYLEFGMFKDDLSKKKGLLKGSGVTVRRLSR